MKKDGSLSSAFACGEKGKIEDWIHHYLNNEGNNVPFSLGLKLEPRFFIGPIKMPLKWFKRCCGPEKDLKYVMDADDFERNVAAIKEKFMNGWDMPPLIVNYCHSQFELNDGNHRLEALNRLNVSEYEVIIWMTENDDYQQFKQDFQMYL